MLGLMRQGGNRDRGFRALPARQRGVTFGEAAKKLRARRQEKRESTSDALVPPKPNELERAWVIFFSRAFSGMRSSPATSSAGSFRWSVGGKMPCSIASAQIAASTAPAAPSK